MLLAGVRVVGIVRVVVVKGRSLCRIMTSAEYDT